LTASSAVRACWLRWPRHRTAEPRAAALAAAHGHTHRLRDCWRRWPRSRVPSHMSMAVAAAHDRVGRMQRCILTWRLRERAAALVATQRTAYARQHLVAAWRLLVIGVNAQLTVAPLMASAIEFADHSACARRFREWAHLCLGYVDHGVGRSSVASGSEAWGGEELLLDEGGGTAGDWALPAVEEGEEWPDWLEGAASDLAEQTWRSAVQRLAAEQLAVETGAGASASSLPPLSHSLSTDSMPSDARLGDPPLPDFDAAVVEETGPPPPGGGGDEPRKGHLSTPQTIPPTVRRSTASPAAPSPRLRQTPRTAGHVGGGGGAPTPPWTGDSPRRDSSGSSMTVTSAAVAERRLTSLMLRPLCSTTGFLYAAFRRWARRLEHQSALFVLAQAASLCHVRACLLAAVTWLWRHAVDQRSRRAMIGAAHLAHAARRQSAALQLWRVAGQAPWWRLKRELVFATARGALRREAGRMMRFWAELVRPMAKATRVQRIGHVRSVLRASLAVWRDGCEARRELAFGYMRIAARVGLRVALGSFERWRHAAEIRWMQMAVGHACRRTRLDRCVRAWVALSSRRATDEKLLSYHASILSAPRRLETLRTARDAWRRHVALMGARRTLHASSVALFARACEQYGMRRWRDFAQHELRNAMRERLATVAGPSAAQRRLTGRVADSFAQWRQVCVDVIPPVLRQLLHVRRRMEQSQASTSEP
jgi:phage terminase small subunit